MSSFWSFARELLGKILFLKSSVKEGKSYTLSVHAKLLQPCPTHCDPMDCSPPGSSVLATSQARALKWVPTSPGDLPNPAVEPASLTLQGDLSDCNYRVRIPTKTRSCCRCLVIKLFQIFVTPWTIVHQAPLSMGFPRQEYRSEFPFLCPGDLPNPDSDANLAFQ